MSKAATIDAIVASATDIFCRDGFDGSSLRDIAAHAGVSLSSIHEYFESKAALYVQVGRLLFQRIDGARHAALQRCRDAGEDVGIDQIVYAMVAPIVMARPDEDHTWSSAHLRTWYSTTSYLRDHADFREDLRNATAVWAKLISDACPGLSFQDGVFGHAVLSSLLLNWDATNSYLTGALAVAPRHTAEEEARLLAQLVSAGLREIAARRRAGHAAP